MVGFVDAVDDVVGHGLGGVGEDGGLVHVVPEAGCAVGDEVFEEGAPPGAGGGLGEVGEDRGAGPDGADVILAVELDEVVAGFARVVGGVGLAGEVGDVEVGDEDGVEVLGGEAVEEAGEVGVVGGIDGEGAVLVLEVDIEPDGVGGNLVGAEAVGDFVDLGFWKVGVAGLLVAEGPKGREGRRAGKPGVGLNDLFRVGAVEEVVVEGASGGGESVLGGVFAAEVEEGAEGVVEEDAEGAAVVHVEKEGDGLVDGVGGFLEAEAVGVPHGESFAGAVEGAGLVAEAEEMAGEGLGLGYGEALWRPGDGEGVGLQDVAGEVGDGEAEVWSDSDAEGGGGEAVGVGSDGGGGGAGGGEDGPGGVFGRMIERVEADAEDVGPEGVYAEGEVVVRNLKAGGGVGRGGELRGEDGGEGGQERRGIGGGAGVERGDGRA